MQIYQIMSETAAKYGARHSGFDQSWKLPILPAENKGGICAAMTLGWLKSKHKHGYLSNKDTGLSQSDSRVAHIGRRQTKLSHAKYEQSFTDALVSGNRDGKGFGALGLTRDGDPFIASAVLAGIKGYDLIPLTANILWNTPANQGCTMSFGSTGMKERHMVGTCKAPREFMFFDPNGGLMSFQDPDRFHAWIMQQFFKDHYYAGFNYAYFVYYKIG